jgi:hypothetical protein
VPETPESDGTGTANFNGFLLSLDLVDRAVAGVALEHHAVTGEAADVFLAGAGRNPAAQVERGWTERRQPLSVEFAGDVEMPPSQDG